MPVRIATTYLVYCANTYSVFLRQVLRFNGSISSSNVEYVLGCQLYVGDTCKGRPCPIGKIELGIGAIVFHCSNIVGSRSFDLRTKSTKILLPTAGGPWNTAPVVIARDAKVYRFAVTRPILHILGLSTETKV